MAKLVCRAGPDAGHEYPIDKEKIVFGRRSSCDVQIKDSMASREHFVVRKAGKLYTVSDLESRNGTKLNGRKITERQLEFGDVLSVGEVEWLIVKEEGDVEIKDLLTSKYEILEKIGEGGMGIVYKAIQRSMDRTVALKILAPKYAARPKFVNHFIEEARAAGRLNHPNIIQVHDVDTENGIHYFSMEFIEGATCMQMLRTRGPFPVTEAIEITRLTAKALQYAHEQRIIHRDVKPDNIMVGTNNVVKLADLGISKSFDEAGAEDTVKRIVGTPHYMAPEVAMGKKIDHRIDIYSLGATLYQLLTGKTLFPSSTASELLKAQIKKDPKPLHELNANLPAVVQPVMDQMLAKEPDDRFGSAQEVIEALEVLQMQHGLAPELPTSGETRMLRRFATGKRDDEDDQEATAAPPPKTPTDAGKPATKGSRTRPQLRTSQSTGQYGDGSTALLKWFLVLVLLGLAGVLAWQLRHMLTKPLNQGDTDNGTSTTSGGSSATTTGNDSGGNTGTGTTGTGGDTPPRDPLASQRQQLAELKARISRATGDADLKAIRRDLDDLGLTIADAGLQRDIAGLRKALDARMQSQQVVNETDMLRNLRREIETYLLENNYRAALDRLKSFRTHKSDSVRQEVNSLEAEVTREKDAFTKALRTKMQRMVVRNDAAALRKLKAELPEGLIDDPVADEIQQAINTIDDQLFKKHEAEVQKAVEALGEWDLADVARLHDEWYEEMTAQALRDRMDQLLATAKVLEGLHKRLDQAIKAKAGTRLRMSGKIQNMNRPELKGATAEGLIMTVSTSSGTIRTNWAVLSTDEFKAVFAMVFDQTPKDLDQALQVFFEARSQSD